MGLHFAIEGKELVQRPDRICPNALRVLIEDDVTWCSNPQLGGNANMGLQNVIPRGLSFERLKVMIADLQLSRDAGRSIHVRRGMEATGAFGNC